MCILYERERERNRWCPMIKIKCQVVAIVFVLCLTSTCTLYKLMSLEQILALAPLLRGIPTHKIIIVVLFSKSENVWHSFIFRLRLWICTFFTFKPLHLCFVYTYIASKAWCYFILRSSPYLSLYDWLQEYIMVILLLIKVWITHSWTLFESSFCAVSCLKVIAPSMRGMCVTITDKLSGWYKPFLR